MYWAAENKSVWIVLPNAMFPFICQNILVDGAILALNNLSCSPWIIRRLGGPVMIVPLRGSILQAETCQILRLAENPRWSPSVAIMNQNYYPILNPCTVAAVYELIHRALDVCSSWWKWVRNMFVHVRKKTCFRVFVLHGCLNSWKPELVKMWMILCVQVSSVEENEKAEEQISVPMLINLVSDWLFISTLQLLRQISGCN